MSEVHWFENTALIGFYAMGLVAIIACLRVIILSNPVHAILSMIVALLALAGIFFIIGAPFAGALQVIVYAGAILVLFVFVIMMLNLGIKNDERESKWLASDVWAVPTGLTFIIAVILFYIISSGGDVNTVNSVTNPAMIGASTISSKQVGISLFSEYLLLVEIAAMLLLAALVAAYHLGKRALDDENFSHNSNNTSKVDYEFSSTLNSNNLSKTQLAEIEQDLQKIKPVYEPVEATEFKKNADTKLKNRNDAAKEDR